MTVLTREEQEAMERGRAALRQIETHGAEALTRDHTALATLSDLVTRLMQGGGEPAAWMLPGKPCAPITNGLKEVHEAAGGADAEWAAMYTIPLYAHPFPVVAAEGLPGTEIKPPPSGELGEWLPLGTAARVKALESIAEQAARYIETIVRPNETTETISSSHLWARGIEIAGGIRALLPQPPAVSGAVQKGGEEWRGDQ